MKIFLSKPDRERYGIESTDGLDVDLGVVMQDEAEQLDEHGIDPDGKAWFDWINSGDIRVWRVLVWLALRRGDVDVRLADVKFNRRATRYAVESPGKDESASETSDDSTKPPSSDGSE